MTATQRSSVKQSGKAGERRRHPRFSRRFSLTVGRRGENDVEARSIDISRNGVYCRVNQPIPLMTHLTIRFELASGSRSQLAVPVECEGVVVRSERVPGDGKRGGFKVAIFFQDASREALSKLARLIDTPAAARSAA